MQLPREILIGRAVTGKIGEVCTSLGLGSTAVILTGPHTGELVGRTLSSTLENSGFRTRAMIVNSPTIPVVNEAKLFIRRENPSVIIGVGGGKVIDVAKLSSSQTHVPFVSVPTAASHDGIASSRVSLKGEGLPFSTEADAPTAIIADTEIIGQAPRRLAASGYGDVISKYTAVYDWRLANKVKGEYYGEYAASLALMSAQLLIRRRRLIANRNEESMRVLLEALISCGVAMSIAGSSRPGSGSEHLFCHALDLLEPNSSLHGERCGVGAIMMARLQGRPWKILRDSLRIVGAPVNAKGLNVNPEQVIRALQTAHTMRKERYTILGEEGLTRSAAEDLAQTTGVI